MENMQTLLSIKYQKSYQKEQNGSEKSNECTFKYCTGVLSILYCTECPALTWSVNTTNDKRSHFN